MDLDSHGGDSYGDIPPDFQSPLSPAPYTNHVETNLATLAGAAGEEAANMMGEDVNLASSDIPTMPLDVNPVPSPIAVGSRRGHKKKSEKEREEFWSRRPNWLPEGWEMDVRIRKDGATAGIRDRGFRPSVAIGEEKEEEGEGVEKKKGSKRASTPQLQHEKKWKG
ncbi:hypothetical protein MRB53_023840 [Persea americana]|uniref:Uncharacterized protein n=1 Tax=Persea americana TaxID=3435 RepID=A0ACC2LAW7_PERAE|nr:hypothetical protein MRB53_023840 [Persea americana]